jgi:hypothetical protein
LKLKWPLFDSLLTFPQIFNEDFFNFKEGGDELLGMFCGLIAGNFRSSALDFFFWEGEGGCDHLAQREESVVRQCSHQEQLRFFSLLWIQLHTLLRLGVTYAPFGLVKV